MWVVPFFLLSFRAWWASHFAFSRCLIGGRVQKGANKVSILRDLSQANSTSLCSFQLKLVAASSCGCCMGIAGKSAFRNARDSLLELTACDEESTKGQREGLSISLSWRQWRVSFVQLAPGKRNRPIIKGGGGWGLFLSATVPRWRRHYVSVSGNESFGLCPTTELTNFMSVKGNRRFTC